MKTKDAEDEPLAGLFKPSFAMIPSASDGGVKAIEIDGEETLVLQGLWGQISSKKLSNIYAHGSTIYAKLKPAGGKSVLVAKKDIPVPAHVPLKVDTTSSSREIIDAIPLSIGAHPACPSASISAEIDNECFIDAKFKPLSGMN
jgi:hypothetical protein